MFFLYLYVFVLLFAGRLMFGRVRFVIFSRKTEDRGGGGDLNVKSDWG